MLKAVMADDAAFCVSMHMQCSSPDEMHDDIEVILKKSITNICFSKPTYRNSYVLVILYIQHIATMF